MGVLAAACAAATLATNTSRLNTTFNKTAVQLAQHAHQLLLFLGAYLHEIQLTKRRHATVVHMIMQERLGNLTNKCMDGGAADLEYFVQESAHILGLQDHAHDAKVVLRVLSS